MTLISEAQEIIEHAKQDYREGKLTAEQFCDVTRIPMKDMFLTLYAHGEKYLILKSDIYVPAFEREGAF